MRSSSSSSSSCLTSRASNPAPHLALPPLSKALVRTLMTLPQRLLDIPAGADPTADLGALLQPEFLLAALAEAVAAVAALGGAHDADIAVDDDAAGRGDEALEAVGLVAQRNDVLEQRAAGQAERIRQGVGDEVVDPAAQVGRLGIGG